MRKRFPWYNSHWLTEYLRAKDVISAACPEQLPEFLETLAPLRTRPEFKEAKVDSVLNSETLEEAREVVRDLDEDSQSSEEFFRLGRRIVRNHPFLTQIQKSLTGLASDLAGEPLEPFFNFLSLYTNLGSCEPHLDSPTEKYTLDICLEHSRCWPIHVGVVRPWPEDADPEDPNWEEEIRNDPGNQFTKHELEPGQALLFSGSSQWHYRDRIAAVGEKNHFCHQMMLHFVPQGASDYILPASWPERFRIPELGGSREANSES